MRGAQGGCRGVGRGTRGLLQTERVRFGGFEQQDFARPLFYEEGEVGEYVSAKQGWDVELTVRRRFKNVYPQIFREIVKSQRRLGGSHLGYSAETLTGWSPSQSCGIDIEPLEHVIGVSVAN